MRIRVETKVTIEDGPQGLPSALEYRYTSHYGDNPRFWGDCVQRVVGSATNAILDDLSVRVDLREE